MNTAEILVLIVSVFFILITLFSIIRWSYWLIRIADFPRLQISFMLTASIAGGIIVFDFHQGWHFIIVGLAIASLVFQLTKIAKYTFLAKTQVLAYKGGDTTNALSILVSNVLQTNRNAPKLLKLVEKLKPDLLLTLETNKWWDEQLQVLSVDYPYSIKKPLDNLYGMILYSKLELENIKIKYLVQENIPSFEAVVTFHDHEILIHCLHPKPPFPSESSSSTNRDAELLLVGKQVEKEKKPVLIFGDFNDVAWSRTTSLFQKMSELLDPRVGRGFFNTL